MAAAPALGEAEGLDGGFDEIVDQDRRRGARAQSGELLAGLGDEFV